MGLFNDREQSNGKTTVPVWFMRQAGRYHSHYQGFRAEHSFMEMCKNPKLACEITMGPIEEFDFDAAILFSDLLFPLEQLGTGLHYSDGPPKLEKHLDSSDVLKNWKLLAPSQEFYQFQKEACILLREKLPKHKTLLGFAGAPFTLYTYAVEGAHKGNLIESKKGLYDGRFAGLMEKLVPLVVEELLLQLEGGADAVCLFDTAAGELGLREYRKHVVPEIKKITSALKSKFPDSRIVYYSKFTHLDYHLALEDDNIDVLGVDWRTNLKEALNLLGPNYIVQGNLDPALLHLPWNLLEEKWLELFRDIDGADLSRWICGLGHGVLPQTPEQNVKNSVELIHSHFRY